MAAYLLDNWSARQDVQLSLGVRYDWDSRTRDFVWEPRLSLAWSPLGDRRTRISGGFAVSADAVTPP